MNENWECERTHTHTYFDGFAGWENVVTHVVFVNFRVFTQAILLYCYYCSVYLTLSRYLSSFALFFSLSPHGFAEKRENIYWLNFCVITSEWMESKDAQIVVVFHVVCLYQFKSSWNMPFICCWRLLFPLLFVLMEIIRVLPVLSMSEIRSLRHFTTKIAWNVEAIHDIQCISSSSLVPECLQTFYH